MPDFVITSPEGQQYRVSGPDGSTEQQALAHLQDHLGAQPDKVTLGTVGNQALTDIKNFGSKLVGAVAGGATYARDVSSGDAQLPGVHYVKSGQTMVSDEDMARGQATAMPRLMDMAGLALPVNPAVRSGDAVLPGAGGLKKIIPAPTPPVEDIAKSASGGFDQVQNSGAAIKSDALKTLGGSIQNDLVRRGLRREFAGDTHAILDDLAKPPEGSVATMADVKALRESLGQAGGSIDGRERMAAGIAKDALDKYLSDIPKGHVVSDDPQAVADTLKNAIGDYATVKRSQDITSRIDKAENNAGAANSGMNVENGLRQQFKQILNNPAQQRGYTAEQLAVIRKFVRGDAAADTLRAIGNLLGGGLGMHGAAMAGAGFMAAGPAGLALPLAGMGTKFAGNFLARSRAAALDRMVRATAPYAKSLPPQTVPYGQVPAFTPQMLGSSLQWSPQMLGAIPVRADDNQR